MPNLQCRGISEETVKKVSIGLTGDLAELLEIPRDRFSFTLPSEIFIKEGELAERAPSIRIAWFERPEELMEKAAAIVKKHFAEAGVKEVGIYYENLYKKNSY